VDEHGRRLFTDVSDDGRPGGLFTMFSHDNDDTVSASDDSSGNVFSFLTGFNTSIADMSGASDSAEFQFVFGDNSLTSDDDNVFSLF